MISKQQLQNTLYDEVLDTRLHARGLCKLERSLNIYYHSNQ